MSGNNEIDITGEHVVYKFSPSNPAKYRINSGDVISVRTPDCFHGQIQTEKDSHEKLDMHKVNDSVGPIYVEGAEPGDTLSVEILNIEVIDNHGVMMVIQEYGLLKDEVKESRTKICPIKNGEIRFSDRVTIPVMPSVGTIGVAPSNSEIDTVTPGYHGGNLDTAEIGAGNIILFPVNVRGALLALGDCHAAIGDGEICVTGVEVPAVVKAKVEVVKDLRIDRPIIETKDEWMTLASAENLEEACRIASKDMIELLRKNINMSFMDAYMLLSAVGRLKISQMVNPLVTVRMCLSKKYLSNIR